MNISFKVLTIFCATLFGHTACQGLQAAETNQDDKVLDAFLKFVKTEGAYTPKQRQFVEKLISSKRAQTDAKGELLTDALSILHAPFNKAMLALGDEQIDQAVAGLSKLSTTKTNPYLKAQATFFLGRAHIMREDFEKAIDPLEKLQRDGADNSLYPGEAMFLLGVSQAKLLKRKEAMTTF